MHWIGALYTPGSLPTLAYRPFELLHDFRAIVFLPRVTADEIPTDLPRVVPRKR